jgi:hypothetical protein
MLDFSCLVKPCTSTKNRWNSALISLMVSMEAMKKLKCSGFCRIRPILLTFLFTAHLYTTIDMASWVMLHALLHTVLCPLVDLKRQASHSVKKFGVGWNDKSHWASANRFLPALRALYTQVANGGLGPGYGIIGAIGGFPHWSDGRCKDIADGYNKGRDSIQHIDLAAYEKELAATLTA